jgi:hypothetical protein
VELYFNRRHYLLKQPFKKSLRFVPVFRNLAKIGRSARGTGSSNSRPRVSMANTSSTVAFFNSHVLVGLATRQIRQS